MSWMIRRKLGKVVDLSNSNESSISANDYFFDQERGKDDITTINGTSLFDAEATGKNFRYFGSLVKTMIPTPYMESGFADQISYNDVNDYRLKKHLLATSLSEANTVSPVYPSVISRAFLMNISGAVAIPGVKDIKLKAGAINSTPQTSIEWLMSMRSSAGLKVTVQKGTNIINNKLNLGSEAIANDISTAKVLLSLKKVRENLVEYWSKNPKYRLDSLIDDSDLFNTVITNIVDFGTLLRIYLKAQYSVFRNVFTRIKKSGYIENSLKNALNDKRSLTNTMLGLLELKKLAKMFPFNKHVVDMFDKITEVKILKNNKELYYETNPIIDTMVQLTFHAPEDGELPYIKLSSSIAHSAIDVPTMSLVSRFVKLLNQNAPSGKHNPVCGLSKYHQTAFQAAILNDLSSSTELRQFIEQTTQKNLNLVHQLELANAFNETVFSREDLNDIDFPLSGQFEQNSQYPGATSEEFNTSFIDTLSMFKGYQPQDVANKQIRKSQNAFLGINSGRAIASSLVKFFIINSQQDENNNLAANKQDRGLNLYKGDLQSIILTDGVVSPFLVGDKFSFDDTLGKDMVGELYTFTSGINQKVTYVPVKLEWTNISRAARVKALTSNGTVNFETGNDTYGIYLADSITELTLGNTLNTVASSFELFGDVLLPHSQLRQTHVPLAEQIRVVTLEPTAWIMSFAPTLFGWTNFLASQIPTLDALFGDDDSTSTDPNPIVSESASKAESTNNPDAGSTESKEEEIFSDGSVDSDERENIGGNDSASKKIIKKEEANQNPNGQGKKNYGKKQFNK